MFPVQGNHEVQDVTVDANGKKTKKDTLAYEKNWRSNMSDVILDDKASWDANNDPKTSTDKITTNQKQLDYSFDYHGTHVAVINTDLVGKKTRLSPYSGRSVYSSSNLTFISDLCQVNYVGVPYNMARKRDGIPQFIITTSPRSEAAMQQLHAFRRADVAKVYNLLVL